MYIYIIRHNFKKEYLYDYKLKVLKEELTSKDALQAANSLKINFKDLPLSK